MLGAAGWWFGVEQPKRVALEAERVAAQRAADEAEAARLADHESANRTGQVRARETTTVAAALEEIRGPKPGTKFEIEDMGMTLVPIDPGTFMMGSPTSESGRRDDERQHRVTLTQPYWLGATEVTQGQWQALMGTTVRQQRDKANPDWSIRGESANNPIYYVSWAEAMEYCRKLTERERVAGRLPDGYAYTLPTEAQWEYACRAGTTGAYAGDLDAMGWYDSNSNKTTQAVGQKRANGWGLYDMHGNLWEWCLDWWEYYSSGSVTDPDGPNSGTFRVYRGGSWGDTAQGARSANRDWGAPDFRVTNLGFRLALAPSSR